MDLDRLRYGRLRILNEMEEANSGGETTRHVERAVGMTRIVAALACSDEDQSPGTLVLYAGR